MRERKRMLHLLIFCNAKVACPEQTTDYPCGSNFFRQIRNGDGRNCLSPNLLAKLLYHGKHSLTSDVIPSCTYLERYSGDSRMPIIILIILRG
mmetsp:Transcript_31583/g.67313  ORF Transcript_31583/g.67313 Transcript_31583/m.67313 type:complete len:93 (-) Transcript_31583:149-427(-)